MMTTIFKGNREYGTTYYQGFLWIVQGRLQHTWKSVTNQCSTYEQARQELEDFIASVRTEE